MPADREQRGLPPAHATGAVQFVAVDDIAADEAFRLRADGDVTQLATALGRLGQLAPVELRPWPGAGSDGPRWQVVSGFRRLAAVRMLARERVLARIHHELGEEDAWGIALGEALLHQPLTGEELEALRERLRASGVAPWAEELVDEALVRAPVAAELREWFYEFLTSSGSPTAPPAAPERIQATAAEPVPLTPTAAEPVPSTRTEPVPETVPETEPVPETAAAPLPATEPVPDAPTPTASTEPEVERETSDDYVEVTPDELVQDLVARLGALNQDLATAVEAWKDLPAEGRKTLVEQARYVAELLPYMEAQD